MQGRMGNPDPSSLRISDQDRHQVTEVLRLAAGEGRIDLDELDERLEAAYSAKTYADLVPITADLPITPLIAPPVPRISGRPHVPPSAEMTYFKSVGVLSETRRRGQWLVPEEHTCLAVMGTVQLDLREAEFAAPEVTINAYAIMGEVKVVVDAHTRVHVDGVAVMADFGEARAKVPAELTDSSPTVRVKGLALMGTVTVQRRPPPGETLKRLGWAR